MASKILSRVKPWLPVLGLGFSVFIFVTTEMLPVGLLPDIAASLVKTEAQTGLLLTAYAWSVAILSLPLTVLTVRFNRRGLLVGLLLIFIFGNVFSAMADSFRALLGARLCIAMAHAVFWSIVTPLAVRVAPSGGASRAIAVVVTCASIAVIAGVPIGTILGNNFGWRFAFGVVAAAGACVLGALLAVLPSVPSSNAGSLLSLPLMARDRNLLQLYLLTLVAVVGHFILFTYLAPVMRQTGGFAPPDVALMLTVVGCSGIAGSMAGSRYASRPGRRYLVTPLLIVSGLMALMPVFVKTGYAGAAVFCFAWGMLVTFVNMVFSLRVLANAPDYADIATSVYSGTFNIGIGSGAFIGSWVYECLGIMNIHYAACLFLLSGAVLAMFRVESVHGGGGKRPAASR